MKLKLLPFVNVMQSLRLAVSVRQKVAAIAIGYASACQSHLPAAEVANAEEYYRATHQSSVRTLVGMFNEGVVIDTTLAQEFARKFWLLRYEAVHRCPRMDQLPGDFFSSVFGVAKFFPPDLASFCNENAADIALVYRVVCALSTEAAQEPAGAFA